MLHPRPLSPHLQIYRWQLTSVLSILHRFTGVALTIGAFVLAVWLVAAAKSPESFQWVQRTIKTPLGIVMMIGWTFALFYHLCNGIRHLFWDAGFGFELKDVYRSGWWVIISATALTGSVWVVGWLVWQ